MSDLKLGVSPGLIPVIAGRLGSFLKVYGIGEVVNSKTGFSDWIDVEDELPTCNPDDQVWQLVCNKRSGNMEVASFWMGCWLYSGGQRAYGITHWMPLPDAPR